MTPPARRTPSTPSTPKNTAAPKKTSTPKDMAAPKNTAAPKTRKEPPGTRSGPDRASRRPAPGTAPLTDRKAAPAGGATEQVRSAADDRWPVADRSLIITVPGVAPVAAVGLAVVLTAAGVLVDLTRSGTLGVVFTVCYVVGCVLAVAWVRRSGLFAPMVQPPLLLAVTIPVVVLLAGTPKPGAGIAERLLVVGAPLVNSFPTMAWTTGIVVALGVFRLATQRLRPERPATARPKASGEAVSSAAERRGGAPAAARAATRTSRSPRRS